MGVMMSDSDLGVMMSDSDLYDFTVSIQCLAAEAEKAGRESNRVILIARLAEIHLMLMRNQTFLYPKPSASAHNPKR